MEYNIITNETFFTDIVQTPFAEYIVVDYTDKKLSEDPKWKGGVFDLSGKHVFNFSRNGYHTPQIFDFFMDNPSLEVEEECLRDENFKLPSGKIGDILKYDNIDFLAEEYMTQQSEMQEKLKSQNIGCSPLSSLDEFKEFTKRYLVHLAWEQLIKKSSKEDFIFNYKFPDQIIKEDNKRGFAVLDREIYNNCGHGTGTLYIYKTLTQSGTRNKGDIFDVNSIESRLVLTTNISRLSLNFCDREKIKELSERGKIITLDDELFFISPKKE